MGRFIFTLIFILTLIGFSIFWLRKNTSLPSKEVYYIPNLVRNIEENFFTREVVEKEIILKFTGDVILARSVNFISSKKGDFTWPFKNVASELKNADLTISNLESPLIDKCPLTNEGLTFCGDKRFVSGLSFAGIDVVGMANNHAGNYGKAGVSETIKNLDSVGILSSGTEERQIAYKNINNIQFAFLAFNAIPYSGAGVLMDQEELIKNLLIEAKKNSDFVVVQMHWGTEYTRNPNEYQKNMGRFLIDNGADLVVGNHPHWIQDYEIYKGKYILFALGNFVFDQEWSQKTKEGVIANFTILKNEVSKIDFTPIEIREYGQANITSNYSIAPKEIK